MLLRPVSRQIPCKQGNARGPTRAPARPISEVRLRRSLDVTNQIQRQITAATQLRGNFAVAITDRVGAAAHRQTTSAAIRRMRDRRPARRNFATAAIGPPSGTLHRAHRTGAPRREHHEAPQTLTKRIDGHRDLEQPSGNSSSATVRLRSTCLATPRCQARRRVATLPRRRRLPATEHRIYQRSGRIGSMPPQGLRLSASPRADDR